MKLNPYLKTFWKTKKQIKVLYGGRMSSKTEDTAGVLAFLSSEYKLRIACLRRFQNKIDESVYKTLKRKINSDEYLNPLFDITNTSIKSNIGSEFIFMGIQRNLEEIKGLDDIDITWIEEAEKLTEDQWNLIRPTILRKEGSFVILVFNPNLDTDFVYREFVAQKHENVLAQKINYHDNPFLSESAKDLIRIDKDKLDEDEFNNMYLGVPKAESDSALIKRSWLYACIDAHKKLGIEPLGQKFIGYDIADSGADKNAMALRRGFLLEHIEQWKGKEDELDKSHTRVFNMAREHDAFIHYDSIGVGAGAGSKFRELNEGGASVKYARFNAGSSVDQPKKKYGNTEIKNEDMFSNLKAQVWWDIADRIRDTYNAVTKGLPIDSDNIISISGEIDCLDDLIIELSSPLKDTDKSGRVKVESKDDLAKRGIKSPNCFIAGTMVLTNKGNIPIEKLKIGDWVVTPFGSSEIAYLHENEVDQVCSNLGLTGTQNHKVFTWRHGWIDLQTVSLCDIIETSHIGSFKWRIMNLLFTKVKHSQFSTLVDIIAQEDMAGKILEMKDFYIGGFGLSITGKFLMAIIFIILTATGVIMKSIIYTVSIALNIKDFICLRDSRIKNTGKKTKHSLKMQELNLKSGIALKTGYYGILNMLKNSFKIESLKSTLVKYVEMFSNQGEHTNHRLVQRNAQLSEPTKELQCCSLPNVGSVDRNFHIQNLQAKISIKGVQENAHMQSKVKVYNITLREHNVYYANGILVKNCADAFIMAYYQPIQRRSAFA